MELQQKTIVVAGGASGLGAACVRLLTQAGARVAILDLNAEAGEALAAELGKAAHFIKTDVTDGGNVDDAMEKAMSVFGAVHGAISCAGIAPAEKILGKDGLHSLATFTNVINVNLIGTFNVIRSAARVIRENEPNASGERGVIITTASIAAFDGQIGQAAYSASKGGIVAMTLPVARELARYGIRVVTIAPGIFDTPLMASLPETARKSLAQQVPFPPRLGRPEEYAALAKHIMENEMLNGEIIRLDGGIRMPSR